MKTDAQWLYEIAQKYPDLPATARGGEVVQSYAELAGDAGAIAAGLLAKGLTQGDRVAIFASNSPEYVTALFAIWWAGLVAVPINAKLHHEELGYILGHADIKMVMASGATMASAEKAAPSNSKSMNTVIINLENELPNGLPNELPKGDAIAPYPSKPDDLAWLFYTSGTTGRPKGAMLTLRNLDVMSNAFLEEVAAVNPGDAIIHAAPMSHGSGLYILPHMRMGACQVIPASGGFDPIEIANLLDRWSGAVMFAAPTMVNRLVRSGQALTEKQLKNLKTIVYGGAPMYAEDAKAAFDYLGPRLAQIYGQGESPMTISCLSRNDIAAYYKAGDDNALASVGSAFSQVDLGVKDGEGVIHQKNAIGEVVVRGDIVMAGYWQNEEATAEAIKDGWLHTGDIGQINQAGVLTLMDRSKDLIISGGSNIYPREVEEILLTHPDVDDVSVIGRRDNDWGEVVVAYVVGSAKAEALDALCLEKMARFKRPKTYVFVESLPKSHYGKILKSTLREWDQNSDGRLSQKA